MKMKKRDLVVNRYGKPFMLLNENLVERMNLTKDNVKKIKSIHRKIFKIQDAISEVNTLNTEEANKYIEKIKNLEFDLQEAWGFEKNENMHTNWFLDTNCSCPKMDNMESFGTKYRTYDSSCKIHGVVSCIVKGEN